MFASFSRRLTSWYVVAAVTFVVVVLSALALAALYAYVHLVQGNIDADAREAEAFSARAMTRGETFVAAAKEFEGRMNRPGVRMVAFMGPPRPGERDGREYTRPMLLKPGPSPTHHAVPTRPSARTYDGPPPFDGPPTLVVNGAVLRGDPRHQAFDGSRIGFALETAFGGRLRRVDFVGGALSLVPDVNATFAVATWLLLAIAGVAALVGLLAWFGGRYITTQVLQPLVEVTHALQRFAARDFTPQPVTVAGKSEFDAIALAYKAAAAQVAAAFAERQAAETQMRQFVADAGHELRTPLTIVLGYIDLLRRKADDGDERSRRIFAAVASEGARMRVLIDNLVLLARMEGDDARPAEPFDLRPLIDEIVDARRILVPSLPIDVDLSVDAHVIGNRDEIHEAIANIVDNAIKYAPDAPLRIAADASAGGVDVTIADRGPGILPADQAAIFDRFYRGATRGDVEGSGLGLAIAKRAVERAGGTLVLQSSTTDGTTFVLHLRADQVRRRETRIARA